jgi:hypothetical protein
MPFNDEKQRRLPPMQRHATSPSKLNIVPQQHHLLPRLEARHAQIRTARASERIAERAIAAAADLALDGEVDLGQVGGVELQRREALVRVGPPLRVLGVELVLEPA